MLKSYERGSTVVIEDRNLVDTNTIVKIGMDGGGGILKNCLSIFDLNQPCSSTLLCKRFLDFGMKKCLLLAL